MSLEIPSNPLGPNGFYDLPAEYASALDSAAALLKQQTDPSTEAEWQEAAGGEASDVTLHRKDPPAEDVASAGVPWVRGQTTVEGATPQEVLATIQIPDMRKKWDPRFESGYPIRRYEPQGYLFYSVMKSPSYFIWARDIVGVQRNVYDSPSEGSITIYQKSVEAEDVLPDAGSYAKSRTRATVELSAWVLEPANGGKDTKVTYIVKVHLNGSIPTAVTSMLATETPMCVGRVRDTLYTTGFAPHDLRRPTPSQTILGNLTFEDGDGTEATAGARTWTGHYLAQQDTEESFEIRYDAKRMYPDGVNFEVNGDAKDIVKVSQGPVDTLKVEVPAEAKGKAFQITITSK